MFPNRNLHKLYRKFTEIDRIVCKFGYSKDWSLVQTKDILARNADIRDIVHSVYTRNIDVHNVDIRGILVHKPT